MPPVLLSTITRRPHRRSRDGASLHMQSPSLDGKELCSHAHAHMLQCMLRILGQKAGWLRLCLSLSLPSHSDRKHVFSWCPRLLTSLPQADLPGRSFLTDLEAHRRARCECPARTLQLCCMQGHGRLSDPAYCSCLSQRPARPRAGSPAHAGSDPAVCHSAGPSPASLQLTPPPEPFTLDPCGACAGSGPGTQVELPDSSAAGPSRAPIPVQQAGR